MSLENFPSFFPFFSEPKMSGGKRQSYEFGSFRLDVAERQLLNDGASVPLTPKAFEVLTVLVERAGHLVEKEELLDRVWADSFVEEINVARIVHTLRKALGEDDNGKKFIETVAKKGYRFVAEVTRDDPDEHTNGQASLNEVADIPAALPKHKLTRSGAHAIVDLAEWREVEARSERQSKILTLVPNEPEIPEPEPASQEADVRPAGSSWRMFLAVFSVAVLGAGVLGYYFYSRPTIGAGKKSIAVLPFKPVDSTSRDEGYELGMADSLINQLGSVNGLTVRPLHATRKYADIEQDPIAAGKEQQADYVLAANYQLADGKIRVTADFFNVATGQLEDTYKSEQDAGNFFAMQDAIAGVLTSRLLARFALNQSNTTAKRGTTNEEAYRLYLQGKNLTAKRSGADAKKAVEYFEQAVRLDPNFALAFVGMARAYSAMGTLDGGFQIQRELYEKAHAAVNKAVELDADLADVYAVRGELKFKEWDFTGAEKDLTTAIELEPNNDLARQFYAMWLNHQGRFDEALAEIEIALEIDPNSLVYQRDRGRFLYFARRYDEAIVHLERVLEIDKNFGTAFHWLIRAYEMKGDYAGAFRWHMEEQTLRNPERINDYQKTYETGGWEIFRRKIIEFEKLDNRGNLFGIARHHALLNEKQQAFEYLNKAFEERSTPMIMLKVEPAFDSLRDDPRFDELLKRVGFKRVQ